MTQGRTLELSAKHQRNYDPSRLVSQGLYRTMERMDSILLGEEVRIQKPLSTATHITLRTMNGRGGKTVQDISLAVAERHTSDPTLTTMGVNYHALAHLMVKSPSGYRESELSMAAVRRRYAIPRQGADTPSRFSGYEEIELLLRALECARVERIMISTFPNTLYYFASMAFTRVRKIFSGSLNAKWERDAALMSAYLFLSMRPYIAGRMRREILDVIKNEAQDLPWFDVDFTNAAMTYISAPLAAQSKEERETTLVDTVRAYQTINDRTEHAQHLLKGTFQHAIADLIALCDVASSPQTQDPLGAEQEKRAQEQADKDQGDGQDGTEGDGEGESEDAGEKPSQDASQRIQEISQQAGQEQEDLSSTAREDESTSQEVESLEQESSGASMFSATDVPPAVQTVKTEDQILSRRLAREFGKIMENADPGFVTHESSGRVNMARNMRGITDYDTAFDLWDEGNHLASSIEMVMALDTSSSMGNRATEVARSAWAISKAVESLGDTATVTTFAFHHSGRLVKPAGTRTRPDKYLYFGASGGTNPMDVLTDAREIVKTSKKAHKIVIILTDGIWAGGYGDHEDYSVLIQKMQKDGAHVALAYLHTFAAYGSTRTYGVDTYRDIDSGDDLVTLASSLVRSAMQNHKR